MDPSAIVVKSLNHEKSYCCKKSTACPNASILKTVGLLSDPEVRLGDDAIQRCVLTRFRSVIIQGKRVLVHAFLIPSKILHFFFLGSEEVGCQLLFWKDPTLLISIHR